MSASLIVVIWSAIEPGPVAEVGVLGVEGIDGEAEQAAPASANTASPTVSAVRFPISDRATLPTTFERGRTIDFSLSTGFRRGRQLSLIPPAAA
jgi:hypothetical protein